MCGILITEVDALAAKTAGLIVGEVIKTVNDYPVDTMDALTLALVNKRSDDIVIVVTNANTYNVALTAKPQDPRRALLGIKVKILECGK